MADGEVYADTNKYSQEEGNIILEKQREICSPLKNNSLSVAIKCEYKLNSIVRFSPVG